MSYTLLNTFIDVLFEALKLKNGSNFTEWDTCLGILQLATKSWFCGQIFHSKLPSWLSYTLREEINEFGNGVGI